MYLSMSNGDRRAVAFACPCIAINAFTASMWLLVLELSNAAKEKKKKKKRV